MSDASLVPLPAPGGLDRDPPMEVEREGAAPLAALRRLLGDEPTSFGFFQAVRLLQRLTPERATVGRFVDPATEAVRFAVPPAISFPPSEIDALELSDTAPARMSVNFMGLTGPQGVLPHQYSLLIADRNRSRDSAIAEFFDLFHHRMLSLFYRAWEKNRYEVAFERGEEDPLTAHLRDFAGISLEAVRSALPVPEELLLFHVGLLAPMPRSARSLEQLLSEYLDAPVAVEQFVGRWYPLPESDQCEIGGAESPSNQLGLGAVAGDEIWDAQTTVRIRIGPLSRDRYDDLLPGGRAYEIVRWITKFFSNDQFDFELQLVLERADVPGLTLGDDQPNPLGWSTWIRTGAFARDADETLLTL